MKMSEIKVGEEYAVGRHGGAYSEEMAARGRVVAVKVDRDTRTGSGWNRATTTKHDGVRVCLLDGEAQRFNGDWGKGTEHVIPSRQVFCLWSVKAEQREREKAAAAARYVEDEAGNAKFQAIGERAAKAGVKVRVGRPTSGYAWIAVSVDDLAALLDRLGTTNEGGT